MKKSLFVIAILLSGTVTGLAGSAYAGGDVAAGKAKSAVCAACHGADGNSLAPTFPKLAGQHESYLFKQLREFKSGARKDSTGMMMGMVAALSDQDMSDISAFFASQKVIVGTSEEKHLSAGRKLFRAGNTATEVSGCMGCHGPDGAGNSAAKFPAIAGQHVDYTTKQLKDFRSGERTNDNAEMMRSVTARMTDADIEALASYLVGLQ